jgi:septation ring formation regulator EzrA
VALFKIKIDMEMELSKKEKEIANDLKLKFSIVREELQIVEAKMFDLDKEAGTLVRKLELLRDQESELRTNLEKKYGQGKLDPINLIDHAE